jgi:hypothetical protein
LASLGCPLYAGLTVFITSGVVNNKLYTMQNVDELSQLVTHNKYNRKLIIVIYSQINNQPHQWCNGAPLEVVGSSTDRVKPKTI